MSSSWRPPSPWRIPFLVSLLLVVIGVYIQFNIEESAEAGSAPSGENSGASAVRFPIFSAISRHPRAIFLAGGAFVANNTCFYIAITYVVAYATSTLHLAKGLMLGAIIVGSLLMMPMLILCGWISDHWGRRPIFMLGAVLTGLWAFAFFPLVEKGSPLLVGLSITVELLLISLMYGPQAALFAELFPAEVRYSGASLGYQLGSVVGGGFAPIIATLLFAQFHATWPIAAFMAAVCVLSLACTAALRRGAAPQLSETPGNAKSAAG
jgi:MFS family permease